MRPAQEMQRARTEVVALVHPGDAPQLGRLIRQQLIERFQAELRDRLAQFALTLHPDKTRLIRFGRRAAEERERAGLGKPETFDFLGFTHICGRSRRGRFLLFRRTRGDRKRAKVREVKEALRRRMHDPSPESGPVAAAGGDRLLCLSRGAD